MLEVWEESTQGVLAVSPPLDVCDESAQAIYLLFAVCETSGQADRLFSPTLVAIFSLFFDPKQLHIFHIINIKIIVSPKDVLSLFSFKRTSYRRSNNDLIILLSEPHDQNTKHTKYQNTENKILYKIAFKVLKFGRGDWSFNWRRTSLFLVIHMEENCKRHNQRVLQ